MLFSSQPFESWQNFYVIVGSSAGALTGLQFVVMALVADFRAGGSRLVVDTFGTPTIVHFCAVLLMAAILSAPWHSVGAPGFLLGVCGVTGVAYSAIVIRRVLRQTQYEPVMEDWIWHAVLPIAAYAMLFAAGITVGARSDAGPWIVALVAMLLLFIGLHNAWDTVATMVTNPDLLSRRQERSEPDTTH